MRDTFGAPVTVRLRERQLATRTGAHPHETCRDLFAASLFTAGAAGATPGIGQLALSDYQATATQVGPNTWHYVGTLHIPVALGVVDVPGASVDMTFNAQGILQTISGTVGFPTLPGLEMFHSLGAMSSTGPSLQIGYDYPAAFDTLALPLDASQRYFYFREQSGASVSWGPLTVQAPNTGATMFALEPGSTTAPPRPVDATAALASSNRYGAMSGRYAGSLSRVPQHHHARAA